MLFLKFFLCVCNVKGFTGSGGPGGEAGSSQTGQAQGRHPLFRLFLFLLLLLLHCCRDSSRDGARVGRHGQSPPGGYTGQLANALPDHVLDVLAIELANDLA